MRATQEKPAEKSAGFFFPPRSCTQLVGAPGYSLAMGFIADFKAKRADKAAQREFDYEHKLWSDDVATLTKIIDAITAASKGEDYVPNTLMQKPGEHTLWRAMGIFHETGRTPSQYVGGSTGVSIPIAKGVRFRVGAMRGQMIPGEELQMDKDTGIVQLTNERLIFTGPNHTREWDFDKLLMLSTTVDESDYFISVYNFKKTSGVRFDPATGREFNRFLGAATAAHESGYEAVLKELKENHADALTAEPLLDLPSKA